MNATRHFRLFPLLLVLIPVGESVGGEPVTQFEEQITIVPPLEIKTGTWHAYAHKCNVSAPWSPAVGIANVVRVAVEVSVDEIPDGYSVYLMLSDPQPTTGNALPFTDVFVNPPDYKDRFWLVQDGEVKLTLKARPQIGAGDEVRICMDVMVLDEENRPVISARTSRCPEFPCTQSEANTMAPDLNTGLIIGP